MTKDNGNWLAAEQAVLPDGTLREDLPLVNPKLPALNAQAQARACSCGGIGCGRKTAQGTAGKEEAAD